jgi:hypothetical protein
LEVGNETSYQATNADDERLAHTGQRESCGCAWQAPTSQGVSESQGEEVTDLIVPIARVVDLVVCDEQIPYDLKGQVSGALRMNQVAEYAHAVGRTAKPKAPLMLYGPDNYMPIMVIGDGVTEAAEMQDLAMEALDRQAESVKKNGRGMNFDEARERAGLVRREDFSDAMKDALRRRADYLRRNWRTGGDYA